MEMELFQPLNNTIQELSSLERRKGTFLFEKGKKKKWSRILFFFITDGLM